MTSDHKLSNSQSHSILDLFNAPEVFLSPKDRWDLLYWLISTLKLDSVENTLVLRWDQPYHNDFRHVIKCINRIIGGKATGIYDFKNHTWNIQFTK
ncbi:MAG: hypothetical protein ACXAC7_09750 [Candidatus Hodarchaeales archaeon]|jgi:hypothetical protein